MDGTGVFIIAFFLIFGIGGTALWVWALVDCATKEADTGNTKIAWLT